MLKNMWKKCRNFIDCIIKAKKMLIINIFLLLTSVFIFLNCDLEHENLIEYKYVIIVMSIIICFLRFNMYKEYKLIDVFNKNNIIEKKIFCVGIIFTIISIIISLIYGNWEIKYLLKNGIFILLCSLISRFYIVINIIEIILESIKKNIVECKNKILYIEVLRVLAIFFVIFNHTGIDGFMLFTKKNIGSLPFFVYMFVSVFCKFSVPVFFMIAGCFLDKYENIDIRILCKKITRIIVILLVGQIFYYIIDITFYNKEFIFIDLFKSIYCNDKNGFMHFLYSYTAMLMLFPILALLNKNLKNFHYEYIIILQLFFVGIIPGLEYIINNSTIVLYGNIKPSWIYSSIVAYPLLGYYFHNKFVITKRKLFIAWGINILTIFLTCYLTYKKGLEINEWNESKSQFFHNHFVIINAITIFITIKYIFNSIYLNNIFKNIFYILGSCTFGVYVIHIFVKNNLKFQYYIVSSMSTMNIGDLQINRMFIGLFMTLIVLLICYVFVYLLRLIPIIKKML